MRSNEDNLQIACVRWFDYQFPELKTLLSHTPNGGYRNNIEAAKFKKMGVRAGFPDLLFLYPNGKYIALAIEMKYGKNKQTQLQKAWQMKAEKVGVKYEVVRTFEGFQKVIYDYLNNN